VTDRPDRPGKAGSGYGAGTFGKDRKPAYLRRKPRRYLPRHKEVLPAGALVSETLATYGLTEKIRGYRVAAEWDQLVGERIGRRTRPMGIVGPPARRVLQVQVASSAWLHELGLLKAQLLDVLWSALGEPKLFEDLSFQLAGRSRNPNDAPGVAPSARPTAPGKVAPPPPAAGPDREQILAETAAVDDDELRDLITRVRTRHNR
jgi:predicted nucleic acid-binding Zn ribbon protein